MSNSISLSDWMETLDREYLSSFIRDGGASVKFAVTPTELRDPLAAMMREHCEKCNYLLVELDAGEVAAHMPQSIFFSMARQINWRVLARRVILRFASERSYRIDGLDAAATGDVFGAIATANGLEARFVLEEIRPQIQDQVFRNAKIAKDFRIAMTHLCIQENMGGSEYAGQALLDWLTGINPRVNSIRPIPIYTSINRTTARYFIESAMRWVNFAGYAGTVVLFDNSRVMLVRNPKDDLRYYTRAMAVDHYELLREFIDGVDRLNNTLFVVVASPDFIDEGANPRSRSYEIYPALRTRVMNDVRDRNLVNPIASLVRLA